MRINMNIHDCIKFANEIPVCYLATTDGDQPRVRALGFWFADETGFYFQTSTAKELPDQIKKNPKTEACFYKHSGMYSILYSERRMLIIFIVDSSSNPSDSPSDISSSSPLLFLRARK
jgi:hypothetical protein